MEKEEHYSANFGDYSLDHQNHEHHHHHHHLHHHHQDQDHQLMKQPRIGETCGDHNNGMVDYMLNNPQQQQQHISSSGFCTTPTSFDKLSFADVMQFADFGPK